jgi:hypothetical protein
MNKPRCNSCANLRHDDIKTGQRCLADPEYRDWREGKATALSDASTPYRMIVGGACGKNQTLWQPKQGE